MAMGGGRADLRTLVERTKCSRTGNSLSRVETKQQARSAKDWLRSGRGKEKEGVPPALPEQEPWQEHLLGRC